ncbi:MAG: hypothetical protein NTZ33_04790 [Bacteroidetes bacterium]|nr:hypothetical protein [Bacteroidota bacterium]
MSNFKNLIIELPVNNQSFDIKIKNWICEDQSDIIYKIFNGKSIITLNRFDIINSSWDLKEFVIKTLMWGYPTKGRGKNIDILLKNDNFNNLINILQEYVRKDISINKLEKDIKLIDGLGLSTMSKFAYFLNTRIEGFKALILDQQIIDIVDLERYDELMILKGINYENAIKRYKDYLIIIDKLSLLYKTEPENIEMFLFPFGKYLSELIGEEGDYSEL